MRNPLFLPTSLCGVPAFGSVSRLPPHPPRPPLSHTTFSHTIFHTNFCHTHTHTHIFVTYKHTIFHTKLCHTTLSHTALSHTASSNTHTHTSVSQTTLSFGVAPWHFAWQVWHSVTSRQLLRCRRGTYSTGLCLVAAGSELVCDILLSNLNSFSGGGFDSTSEEVLLYQLG